MILGRIFNIKSINTRLESETRDEVFEELLEAVIAANPQVDRAEALAAVREREAKMSTGIMRGIAVPHGKTRSVKGVVGAVGISHDGIDYESLDNAPVNLVFLLLTDPNDHEYHLTVLKRLSQVLDSPAFISTVLAQTTAQGVYDTICKFESLVSAGQ